MMYYFKKPDAVQIKRFIEAQSQLELTYPQVGATKKETFPSGFIVDHNRVCLGTGEVVFQCAKKALCDWQQFNLGWVELHHPEKEPESEQTVAMLANAFGLWWLNACRVVYVINEIKPIRKYAFAYGTLPSHIEAGEERFQIEWREDDTVWYDIFAFSKSNKLLAKIGHPYVRAKQKKFARDSKVAMKAAANKTMDSNF